MLTRKHPFPVRTCALAALLALAACEQAPDTTPVAAPPQPAPAAVESAAPAPAGCDRQCLIAATDAYVAALVAHDPSAAPLAASVAFVENLVKKQPGEGLWQTAVSAPGTFAIHVPDAINRTVGYLAMMTRMAPPLAPQGTSPEEAARLAATAEPTEQPVMVAFRLQFDEAGRITEAEHLLTSVREPQLANLQAPRPGIFTEIPADQRLSHDRLIELGLSYYDALDDNDSDLTAFAPDCERHENGMITASSNPRPAAPAIPGTTPTPAVARDCYGQIESGSFQYIARIENRRVFAADPQTGLVMGLSHFRHPMDNLPYQVTTADGSTSERNSTNMPFAPFDLPAAHIYKIGADGLMHEIEAMGFTAPLSSPTGWE